MKKIIINNVAFSNFGANNYSGGMELITCYPMPENMIEDVLQGKYPGVYLNPSAPCSEEFFGLLGTPEQYTEVYNRQKECQISKSLLDKVGGFEAMRDISHEEWKALENQCKAEYKDWWIK